MLSVPGHPLHQLVYFYEPHVNIETGGTVEAPEKSKYSKKVLRNLHLTLAVNMTVSENDLLHQRLSSIMIMNSETGKYELPPPRWFNKDTGEYENIKPMYFLDPNNPSFGLVAPSKIVREDDIFRQFMEDKEKKRRLRIEREREEAKQAQLQALNPIPPPNRKLPRHKNETVVDGFSEELVQRSFRETTGKLMSKRGATQLTGPSYTKKEGMKQELEERYRVLKPFATENAAIKKLPLVINEDEIIQAWKNTPALCTVQKKARPQRTERERIRALIRHKSGKRESTLTALRSSYGPSDACRPIFASKRTQGTIAEEATSEKKSCPWGGELQNHAWWENLAPQSWSPRAAMREENGRLAINPVTGKLEDVSRLKSKVESMKIHVEESTGKFPLDN